MINRAADRLGRWAFKPPSPLAGESIDTYGKAIIQAGAGLESRDAMDIVTSDLKLYQAGGYNFAIAQAEVTNQVQLTDNFDRLTNCTQQASRTTRTGFCHADGDGCGEKFKSTCTSEPSTAFG